MQRPGSDRVFEIRAISLVGLFAIFPIGSNACRDDGFELGMEIGRDSFGFELKEEFRRIDRQGRAGSEPAGRLFNAGGLEKILLRPFAQKNRD
jgi:hypothetical protein